MRPFAFKGATLLVAVAFALAACGRRGPLEPPPDATAPNPAVTGNPGDENAPVGPAELSGQNAANSNSGNQATTTAKPTHKTFLLDPLL
ncbi:MAG TPA: lipoprotein [Methylocella sp.]|nr:lipoprotein [Methylocella sp.]